MKMKLPYLETVACIALLASATHAEDRRSRLIQEKSAAKDALVDPIDETESLSLLVEIIQATDDPVIRGRLLKGMLAGLEGRRNISPPKGWGQLSEELATSRDAGVRKYSMELSQIFGDRGAIDRALAIVKDTDADVGARRSMLRSLLNQQNAQASSLLESLLNEPELTQDAIRGYAIVENKSAAKILLQRYEKLGPNQQRAVVETLASREIYANELLLALKSKAVSRDDIPAHVARSLRDMLGDRFTSVYGKVKSVAQDRQRLLAKYKKLASQDALSVAEASRGRAIFTKTCAACHTLYGEGGKVGPDLTGSNRANLDYILLNSVDPSYDIPDAYKTVTVITVNGRVINGVLAEEDAARIVLKTAEQPRVVIAKEDIEFRKLSPKSMMPDGQLDKMKKQEVLDLIKYLRTTEQVDLSK
jgi:putative heme-binding domain-containing protein